LLADDGVILPITCPPVCKRQRHRRPITRAAWSVNLARSNAK
jgi:hypothetical protein